MTSQVLGLGLGLGLAGHGLDLGLGLVGHVLDSITAIVTARLKKPSLSPGDLNSYRPISNVSFLSWSRELLPRNLLLMPIATTSCQRDSLPIGVFIQRNRYY